MIRRIHFQHLLSVCLMFVAACNTPHASQHEKKERRTHTAQQDTIVPLYFVEDHRVPGDLFEPKITMDSLVRHFGKFGEPTRNVFAELAQIRDSLMKAGVDSLLIIEKKYNDYWKNYTLWRVDLPKPKHLKSIPLRAANPGYIFWVADGQYFVQKIDQFKKYPVVLRSKHDHAPLYDFYQRNREALETQHILNMIPEKMVAYWYEPQPDEREFPDVLHSSALMICGKDTFYETFHHVSYQPQQLTPSDDANPDIANNNLNYYQNQMLKEWIWIKFIDSELYEVEMLGFWD
jgi:hypothetical protein